MERVQNYLRDLKALARSKMQLHILAVILCTFRIRITSMAIMGSGDFRISPMMGSGGGGSQVAALLGYVS